MAEQSRKKVGILFVHGIGEQKRFEHLTGSVQQFAELMRRSDAKATVSVTDRTRDWKYAPGEPDKTSGAPVTLRVTSDHCHADFECHEVWWADLGGRSGIGDVILFWIWGLGQWCAPIYRELDASRMFKGDRDSFNRPVTDLAKTPTSVAGTVAEVGVRLQLGLAALGAVAVGLTWGLAKKLLAAILSQAPSPTIIVQYLGDVRTYEERAKPGDTALSDPGHPRRVGIRRRMITEMVAMADRGYDEWYVAAHSLGTIVAYNGLTEIGHTLPNYLPQQQWRALSGKFKYDTGCKRRENLDTMMPSRPPWLDDGDVINRPLLFGKLKGFLTYGSPLNKFAALWPRVIATATDREDGTPKPFSDSCRWINLVAPADPVAGVLNRFSNQPGKLLHDAVPTVENVVTPWTPFYGLAHIQYFTSVERFKKDRATEQKQRTMAWLMELWPHPIGQRLWRKGMLLTQAILAYIAIVALALLAAAVVVTLAGGLSGLLGGKGLAKFPCWWAFVRAVGANVAPVVALFFCAILLSGLWRWFREARLNVALAKLDADADVTKFGDEKKPVWDALIGMLTWQKRAAATIMAVSVLAGIAIAVCRWGQALSLWLIAAAVIAFLVAIGAQTGINLLVERLQWQEGRTGSANTVDKRDLVKGSLP